MQLRLLSGAYSVCKITDAAEIDWSGEVTFVGKTPDELSLVCETALVPLNTCTREDGWRALFVEGVLEFSLIGILSSITAVLAQAGVSVFCVSTYNTDYILVKEAALAAALDALKAAGHAVVPA